MNFEKLKEIINSIPEEYLGSEVEIQFVNNTKTGKGIKFGTVEGVLFIDNIPLKLAAKEEGYY